MHSHTKLFINFKSYFKNKISNIKASQKRLRSENYDAVELILPLCIFV